MSECNNDPRPLYCVGGFHINAVVSELRAKGVEVTYTTETELGSRVPPPSAGAAYEAPQAKLN